MFNAGLYVKINVSNSAPGLNVNKKSYIKPSILLHSLDTVLGKQSESIVSGKILKGDLFNWKCVGLGSLGKSQAGTKLPLTRINHAR